MDEHTCPACGENRIEKVQREEILKEPFGGQKRVSLSEYVCGACGSRGDFFNENESLVHNSLSELKSNAVTNILEDFRGNRISLSSMERALELPQRTLTKWKNRASNPSAAGVALLKFLRLFPWLIDVAENNYDYSASQKIHLTVAFKKIVSQMTFDESIYPDAEFGISAKSHFFFFPVDKPVPGLAPENKMDQVIAVPEVNVSYD